MADGLVDDYGVPICGHIVKGDPWSGTDRPCRVPVKSAKYADGKCQKHSDDPAAVRRREVKILQTRAIRPVHPFELMQLKVSTFLRLKAALNAIADGDGDTP
jgi:hypothetical protein